MIKRPTWTLLVIFALVIGASFLIKSHPIKTNKIISTPTENTDLITQADGALQSLHVFDNKGDNFQMQRDLSKTWVITWPKSGAANQGLAGAAETQVSALRIIATLDSPPDASVIGLDNPTDTLELGFISGTKHLIEVGDITPTRIGYYIRYDKSKIYIIEQSGITALLNLLTAPPYLTTDTPFPTNVSISTPTITVPSPIP